MTNQNDPNPPSITCKRCGKCCLSGFVPLSEENMDVWRQNGKSAILEAIELSKPVWAGDIIVSSANGEVISICPFLGCEGKLYCCTIYEDRPRVCREYIPGSSELCSQFKYSK